MEEAAVVAAEAAAEGRGEARVRLGPERGMEGQELARRSRCNMIRTCPPCPFGMEKSSAISWMGRSSPQSRDTLFARTVTYVECTVRTTIIKIARPHLLRHGIYPDRAVEDSQEGMAVIPAS